MHLHHHFLSLPFPFSLSPAFPQSSLSRLMIFTPARGAIANTVRGRTLSKLEMLLSLTDVWRGDVLARTSTSWRTGRGLDSSPFYSVFVMLFTDTSDILVLFLGENHENFRFRRNKLTDTTNTSQTDWFQFGYLSCFPSAPLLILSAAITLTCVPTRSLQQRINPKTN